MRVCCIITQGRTPELKLSLRHEALLYMQVLLEKPDLSGIAVDAEPVLDAAGIEALKDLRDDVPPTPVHVPVTHEAAVLEQIDLDSSQPGEGADVAKVDAVDVLVQVGCTPMSAAVLSCPTGKVLSLL